MKRQQAESLMRAHCADLTKKCLLLKDYQTILKDLCLFNEGKKIIYLSLMKILIFKGFGFNLIFIPAIDAVE